MVFLTVQTFTMIMMKMAVMTGHRYVNTIRQMVL